MQFTSVRMGACSLVALGFGNLMKKAIIINRLFVNSIVNRWDLEPMGGLKCRGLP